MADNRRRSRRAVQRSSFHEARCVAGLAEVDMAYREEFRAGCEAAPPRRLADGKAVRPPQRGAEAPGDSARRAKKAGLGKKPVILAVLAAALAFGAYEGHEWWTERPLHGLDRRRLCAGRHHDPVGQGLGLRGLRCRHQQPERQGRRPDRQDRRRRLPPRPAIGQGQARDPAERHRAHRPPDRGRPRLRRAGRGADRRRAGGCRARREPTMPASSSSPSPTTPARPPSRTPRPPATGPTPT